MKSDYNTVYLSLGSNLGESEEYLQRAVALVQNYPQEPGLKNDFPLIRLVSASSVYKTEPQLYLNQNFFFNQVLKIHCHKNISPVDLLDFLQGIEYKLGRRAGGPRYGPRVMDIDILLFSSLTLKNKRLEIPHPRMQDRAFVLVPLVEIEPELTLPKGKSVKKLLSRLQFTLRGSIILQN